MKGGEEREGEAGKDLLIGEEAKQGEKREKEARHQGR